jgi:peptidoglycan-associated lipoprotein
MMFDVMRSRSLRAMTIVAALSLTVALGGCSSLKKKPVTVAGGNNSTLLGDPGAGGANGGPFSNEAHQPIGEPEEFDPSAGIRDVHFDYDRSEIRDDQTAILDRNLAYFKAHPEVKVMVEGHTDERGTVEYNFALGQRRAAAVQDYLLQHGIDAERLATMSKGKEAPVNPGHGESAWSQNRRGHFMKMR